MSKRRARPRLTKGPKSVLRRVTAARLARAEEEDRMDAEWGEQCLRVWDKLAKELGLSGLDAFLAVQDAPLPPRPPGFQRRQQFCNRCGQRTERSETFDAFYCGRCN